VIFVDSSVWIDYFRGTVSPPTDRLDIALGDGGLVTGDIVLTEVLQGFARETDFDRALRLLNALDVVEVAGRDTAVLAARNYRTLRALGVTIRKTIDTLIATRCLTSGDALLHTDRDFELFVTHLGLTDAMTDS